MPSAPPPTSPPISTPLVSLRGVQFRRGAKVILRDVDLTISRGEIVTLIGPNGAGKTTLAKIVLGLIPADGGTVERRDGALIGYAPQSLTVSPTLPLSARRFLGLWGPATGAEIESALDRAGLAAKAATPVHALSGGERQRLVLARALMGDPDLLVLDEPDQALDPLGQAELYARVDDTRRRLGCGVLLISHDLHTVMARADKVVCVNRHICCSGSPETVGEHPEFRALFGDAARQLAPYVHHHDHHHHPDGAISPCAAAPGIIPTHAHHHHHHDEEVAP